MQTVQEGYKTRRSRSNYQDSQGELISWKSIVKQCIAEENYELRMWEFPRAIAMKTDLPVMARQELPTKMLLERIDLRLPRHGLPDFLGKPQADLLAWHGMPRKVRSSAPHLHVESAWACRGCLCNLGLNWSRTRNKKVRNIVVTRRRGTSITWRDCDLIHPLVETVINTSRKDFQRFYVIQPEDEIWSKTVQANMLLRQLENIEKGLVKSKSCMAWSRVKAPTSDNNWYKLFCETSSLSLSRWQAGKIHARAVKLRLHLWTLLLTLGTQMITRLLLVHLFLNANGDRANEVNPNRVKHNSTGRRELAIKLELKSGLKDVDHVIVIVVQVLNATGARAIEVIPNREGVRRPKSLEAVVKRTVVKFIVTLHFVIVPVLVVTVDAAAATTKFYTFGFKMERNFKTNGTGRRELVIKLELMLMMLLLLLVQSTVLRNQKVQTNAVMMVPKEVFRQAILQSRAAFLRGKNGRAF